MAQPDTDRRLAAIVAVDIAGYSSRAEADESAAVLAVADAIDFQQALGLGAKARRLRHLRDYGPRGCGPTPRCRY